MPIILFARRTHFTDHACHRVRIGVHVRADGVQVRTRSTSTHGDFCRCPQRLDAVARAAVRANNPFLLRFGKQSPPSRLFTAFRSSLLP